MTPMDDNRFDDLKDVYVLGALPEGERAAFDAYLSAHPHRQAEVDELGGLAGLLAFAPPEHEPAAGLRGRVMDAVEAESSQPRAARRRSSGRPTRLLEPRNVALAAAAVLLAGLVSWNLLLQGDVRDLRGQVAQTRTAEVAQEDSEVRLGGAWAEQGVSAEVTALNDDRAVLVLEDVPSVPEDRTLQIWVIQDDDPRPSGLLEPANDMAATPITRPLGGADAIAVTVEPAGGSEAPTTDPVLVSEL